MLPIKHRIAYEDPVSGAYFELVFIDNPRHGKPFGWYLQDTISGSIRSDFHLPKDEPVEMATKHAREHCRYLGFIETRIPNGM